MEARLRFTVARRCSGERTSQKKTKRESTKTIYSVCQARRETKYKIEEGKRHIGLCRILGNENRLEKEARLPRDSADNSEARHSNMVTIVQEAHSY